MTVSHRGASRLALQLVAVAAVVIGMAGSAAATDGPDISGDDDAVIIKDSDTGADQSGGDDSSPIVTIPKPYKEYRYVPNCSANSVEGGDVLCGSAVYTCPEDGDIRYQVYTLQHDANGDVSEGADWEYVGTVCRGADDPPEGGPVVITAADIAAEARKAAPATVVHVEPGGKSYVNLPTNFYADTAGREATVQVLGQTIGLRFEPSGYAWKYGDGATGAGAGVRGVSVGGPGAVEHAYRRSGEVSVTLTRTFNVAYTLPGGRTGTLPAPGVSNTSAPYDLTIGEIQTTVTGVR